jgi:predicted ABC-type exoprotein transport system permease subunit
MFVESVPINMGSQFLFFAALLVNFLTFLMTSDITTKPSYISFMAFKETGGVLLFVFVFLVVFLLIIVDNILSQAAEFCHQLSIFSTPNLSVSSD